MAKNNGGQAFPITEYFDEKPIGMERGMSLRDYFAGQALVMAGAMFLARSTANPAAYQPDMALARVAGVAYELADAMLKARSE